MTAHSQIEQPALYPNALAAVRALMPYHTEQQLAARAKPLRMQTRSVTRAAASCSEKARWLWWMINEESGAFVSEPASIEELEELLRALSHLAMAADTFERRSQLDQPA